MRRELSEELRVAANDQAVVFQLAGGLRVYEDREAGQGVPEVTETEKNVQISNPA